MLFHFTIRNTDFDKEDDTPSWSQAHLLAIRAYPFAIFKIALGTRLDDTHNDLSWQEKVIAFAFKKASLREKRPYSELF